MIWSRDDVVLRETRFENERLAVLGVEPMRLSELRAKVAPRRFTQPERIDFFMLMLVTAGRGTHTVDFSDYPLAAGSLVFVRPGQVQQWHLADRVEAELVLIAPAALPHGSGPGLPRDVERLALDEWPTCTGLGPHHAAEIRDDLVRLRRDFERFDATDLDVSLVRHELLILLLRIARQHPGRGLNDADLPGPRTTYRLFRRELESTFASQRSLRYYAARLGYSQSTLSRACLAVEGRPAKQVIDRRVGLEAQRLLAHSAASVAEIAHQLGFSETTNFVKFFRRMTGRTPRAFRDAMTYAPRQARGLAPTRSAG